MIIRSAEFHQAVMIQKRRKESETRMTVFGSCYDPGLLTVAVFQDTVIGKCQTESYGFLSSFDNPCNTNSCLDVTKYIIYICVCIVGFVSKVFSIFSRTRN